MSAIETYKENIELIKANRNYHLTQIERNKEAIKECDINIKIYETKIKELEAK